MVVEESVHEGNVKAISIPTLLKNYNIDYIDILKLDIETSEIQLFSEGYEEWLPKVKIIIIELHDWRVNGCSKAFFEAINKCFVSYTYSISGENTVIINTSI